MERKINQVLDRDDFFTININIIDTKLNPSEFDPITKFLETKVFFTFTDKIGVFGLVNFANYQITTDVSLLPFSQD
jgi:hypothetical protein